MNEKKELRQLSKSQLIALYLEECKARQELEKRVEELERYLKAFDNPHTPPSKQQKKNSEQDYKKNGKPRFPGKPEGSNGGGLKIPPIDRVEEHKLDKCPISGKPLGAPIGYRTQIVIDFPDKPIQTVEHRIMQYICPANGEIIEPEVDLPKGVYGKNIQGITVMLKEFCNSHGKIAQFMRELGAKSFSTAEVQKIADSFASRLEGKRQEYFEALVKESYANLDETPFRRDGQNGYVWGLFSKLYAMFYAASSRAKKEIEPFILRFLGICVSDGYIVYNNFGRRQRCWAHLIRIFKDTAKENKEIEVQYHRLKALYEHLKALKQEPPDETKIAKAKWQLRDIVTCLKPLSGTNKLITYIENGGDDWFTALYYPEVPLDNNHAERELRKVVLLRKNIGCYRNEKGKRWIEIVISVIHTWRLQGLNLFEQLRLVAG